MLYDSLRRRNHQMKKIVKAVSKVLFCLMLVLTVFAAPAYAATSSKPASGKAELTVTKYGGGKSQEFTFNTKTTGSTKLSYECTEGSMWTTVAATHGGRPCYGYFEVQVWGKKGSSWVPIFATSSGTQKNVKNSRSGYFTIKGYTTYKVAIYAWKTETIGKTTSYGSGCYYMTNDLNSINAGSVYSLPKISFKWSNAK